MITIKTRLHDGIYKSQGGGETRVHYQWTTGPRNLLTALEKLSAHRSEMFLGYGNVGCGRSWLEIDGQAIHRYDEVDLVNAESKTARAKEFLHEIASGYDVRKYDY